MPNLTQFEMDAIMRGVHALESIAEELRNLRELKTQELKDKAQYNISVKGKTK